MEDDDVTLFCLSKKSDWHQWLQSFLTKRRKSRYWFPWGFVNRKTVLPLKHHSRRVLMEAQILRAGPSLIFMVEMRCSSRRSSRACPSISCDKNWAASSSQPEQKDRKVDVIQKEKTRTRATTRLPSHSWTPTLKWWDEPADFFHAPLSRSCW